MVIWSPARYLVLDKIRSYPSSFAASCWEFFATTDSSVAAPRLDVSGVLAVTHIGAKIFSYTIGLANFSKSSTWTDTACSNFAHAAISLLGTGINGVPTLAAMSATQHDAVCKQRGTRTLGHRARFVEGEIAVFEIRHLTERLFRDPLRRLGDAKVRDRIHLEFWSLSHHLACATTSGLTLVRLQAHFVAAHQHALGALPLSSARARGDSRWKWGFRG